MIEVKSPGDHLPYVVCDGDEQICTVSTVWRISGQGLTAFRKPDWPATKARAEHIAEALRHYQQSQEGERVP